MCYQSNFFLIKIYFKIFEICGAISVSVIYSTWGSSQYYNFVAVTGIVVAVISIILNLTKITKKFDKVPWNFGVRNKLIVINKNNKYDLDKLNLKKLRKWFLMVSGLF